MNEQIAILLVEDNPGDARLIGEVLLDPARDRLTTARFKLSVADRLATALERLAQGQADVILLDLSLPDSEGLSTLRSICAQAPALPVVVMTSLDDETVAVGAMQAGAQDYLIKGELDHSSLVRAIRYAIERKRAEDALRENEKKLQAFNEVLEQKVAEQTAEVRKLASDLTLAEQRERHRISQILHDDLQQRLYAIQMQVDLLVNGEHREREIVQRDLAEIKQQMQQALAITRHLSIDLSPPILRDEGLVQAIDWLASQMYEQYGLRIDLQAEEIFAIPNEEIQVFLFNCVRELLFNIIKHAGVNRAVVTLQRINGDLRIEVRDDGRGFMPDGLTRHEGGLEAARRRSFGLPTLRRRLSLFGGSMDIQSKPDDGTVVTMIIPVYKEGLKT